MIARISCALSTIGDVEALEVEMWLRWRFHADVI